MTPEEEAAYRLGDTAYAREWIREAALRIHEARVTNGRHTSPESSVYEATAIWAQVAYIADAALLPAKRHP